MRISDWSSDVCSSDLQHDRGDLGGPGETAHGNARQRLFGEGLRIVRRQRSERAADHLRFGKAGTDIVDTNVVAATRAMNRDGSTENAHRSEEQTYELKSLMRNSYAVVGLKKDKKKYTLTKT